MTSKARVALPTLPEITVSRLLDAPRDLVFKAFSDPDNIGKWWGPNGFTAYNHEMDFRVDGIWRFEMRGPDGTRFPSHYSVYTEIQPPKRIVYDHYAAEDNERIFQAVIALNEEGGKTLVTFSLVCSTIEKRDFLVRYGATEGADQTVARLASYLSQSQHESEHTMDNANIRDGQTFTISRVFEAPRALVFASFTEPERMKHWWGPKGFAVVKSAMDLRPGGSYLYGLRAPNGSIMWGRFIYREIVAPERIVLVNSFSDENGGLTRHPGHDKWPLQMLSEFRFEDAGPGKTKFTVSWSPLDANAEEQATFAAGHTSMTQGWSGTFENLTAYLATVKQDK